MPPTEPGKARHPILCRGMGPRGSFRHGDGSSVWRRVMNGRFLQSGRLLPARRAALLATTIAGLGLAAFVLAPHAPGSTVFGVFGTAQAQNLTEKVQQLPQRPVGFADIVEKVKPAVISVRVKIDRPADQGLNTDDGD